MGLGRLLEACQVHKKVALEHSSKSTKYELEGSCFDPIHEHFFLSELPNCRKTAVENTVVVLSRESLKQRLSKIFVRGYFYIGPFSRRFFNWKRCAASWHIVCCDLCCERTDRSPFCEKVVLFVQKLNFCNDLPSCSNHVILSHQHDPSPPAWFFPTNMIVPQQHDPLANIAQLLLGVT